MELSTQTQTQTNTPGPIRLDAEGYLANASQWTPDVANALAREVGVDLSPEHWKVIEASRKDYETQRQSPGLRRITQLTGVSMKDLYRLFPKAPGKICARIAGLPKPKSCL